MKSSVQIECEQMIRGDVVRQSVRSDDTDTGKHADKHTDVSDTCNMSLVPRDCSKSTLQPDKVSLNNVLNCQRRENVELTDEQQQTLRGYLHTTHNRFITIIPLKRGLANFAKQVHNKDYKHAGYGAFLKSDALPGASSSSSSS